MKDRKDFCIRTKTSKLFNLLMAYQIICVCLRSRSFASNPNNIRTRGTTSEIFLRLNSSGAHYTFADFRQTQRGHKSLTKTREIRKIRSVPPNGIAFSFQRIVLQGENVYLSCAMREPIAWLKNDYIIFMENLQMFDEYKFGKGKFKLDANRSKSRYSLLIRSVRLEDAGAYFCQNKEGLRTRLSITVAEQPQCFKGITALNEGDVTTYECVVKIRGENAADAQIGWNKEKIVKSFKQNYSSSTIISSQIEYRAQFMDNLDQVMCFVNNPIWNRTSPRLNCSIGALSIKFKPKLMCSGTQTFKLGMYQVSCDCISNPTVAPKQLHWYILFGQKQLEINKIENVTRMDSKIPHGFRSRIEIPSCLVEGHGRTVEIFVKVLQGEEEIWKSIKLIGNTTQTTLLITALAATTVTILILSSIACIFYRFHYNTISNYRHGESISSSNVVQDVYHFESNTGCLHSKTEELNNTKPTSGRREVSFKNNF